MTLLSFASSRNWTAAFLRLLTLYFKMLAQLTTAVSSASLLPTDAIRSTTPILVKTSAVSAITPLPLYQTFK